MCVGGIGYFDMVMVLKCLWFFDIVFMRVVFFVYIVKLYEVFFIL